MRVSEPVEVYRTADGKHHPTEEKALEHVLDKIREEVERSFLPLIEKGKRSQSEIFETVMTLLPDIIALQKLDSLLKKYDLDR